MEKESVEEATKHIIEVSNTATSGLIEKVTKDDVAALQVYTIRNLDNKLSPTRPVASLKFWGVMIG